jgi:hypothetical protein
VIADGAIDRLRCRENWSLQVNKHLINIGISIVVEPVEPQHFAVDAFLLRLKVPLNKIFPILPTGIFFLCKNVKTDLKRQFCIPVPVPGIPVFIRMIYVIGCLTKLFYE